MWEMLLLMLVEEMKAEGKEKINENRSSLSDILYQFLSQEYYGIQQKVVHIGYSSEINWCANELLLHKDYSHQNHLRFSKVKK